MSRRSRGKIRRIYTIGYGDKNFEDFLKILRRLRVEILVDVRAFPTSKWPEFKKESLERTLPLQGIRYVHLPELGGYRRGGYEAFMESEEFKRGLGKVVRLARESVTCLVCVEPNPQACHRRFIAGKLREAGWEVVHVFG